MRTVGIVLVFFFFACCGGLLSKKYISVLNGVKNAQELLCSIKEGVAGERLTMAEILRGYIFEHKGSERFINMLLSGGADRGKVDIADQVRHVCGTLPVPDHGAVVRHHFAAAVI